MQYHKCKTRTLIVRSGKVRVTLGTPPTDIKGNPHNHDDLGYGAMLNFLSWPPQQEKILTTGDQLTILPFTAYSVSDGDFEYEDSEVIDDEVSFPMP